MKKSETTQCIIKKQMVKLAQRLTIGKQASNDSNKPKQFSHLINVKQTTAIKHTVLVATAIKK